LSAIAISGSGNAFAGGEQQVQLARRRVFRHPRRQRQEAVGGVPHRADHRNDRMAGPPAGGDALRGALDTKGGAERAPAELLER